MLTDEQFTEPPHDEPVDLLAYTIARNVESIAAIPLAEWCGNPEGDAARQALLALAEGGAEVYAYLSPDQKHWNVWFNHERLAPAQLSYDAQAHWLRVYRPQVADGEEAQG